VLKDGQTITLKLQQASVTAAVPGAPTNMTMPGVMTPQITMPGAIFLGQEQPDPSFPGFRRPLIHFRRRLISNTARTGRQPAPSPTPPQ